MANQNQATSGNGCSLEDCYTNLFALTDFGDINYRKYGLESNRHYSDPLEDPLLKAYSRCQEENMLCTWTRVPRDNTDCSKPYVYNNFSKVLWLFWYGNTEPSYDLVAGLKEFDCGNWTQGLTYECRTMLFKALHNVLERCLMKKGFVRIGKWFLQPYRKALVECKNAQYSISFSFFLHGESTVCASLDVRQLLPVSALRSYHLDVCNKRQVQIPVVLSPYGLEAQLTGLSCDERDFDTKKLINSWLRFFPLKFEEPTQENPNSDDRSFVPPKLVEVICGGYRLRYPSCLVLVIDSDLSDSVKEYIIRERLSSNEKPKMDTTPQRSAKNIHSYMGQRAIQRIQQDACIPLKSENQAKDIGSEAIAACSSSNNPFSYNIPSCKADCRCRRHIYRRSNHAASLRRQKMHRFHCQNHLLVQSNDRLDEVDSNCDRNRTPPNLPANDPTMPTLSPQPPTLEQQGVTTAATGVATCTAGNTTAAAATTSSSAPSTTSQTDNGPGKSSTDAFLSIPNNSIPPSHRPDDSLGASPAVSDTRNIPPSCSQLEPLVWPPLGVVETLQNTPETGKPCAIDRSTAALSSPLSPDANLKREPLHSWLDKCLQNLPFKDNNRFRLLSSKMERSRLKSWLDTDMHNNPPSPRSNADGSPCPKIPRYSTEDHYKSNPSFITNGQNSEEAGRYHLANMLKATTSPPAHIFESEDDDGDDKETAIYPIVKLTGASMSSSTGSGSIASSELSRMFPTPPSLENHTSPIEQPTVNSCHISTSAVNHCLPNASLTMLPHVKHMNHLVNGNLPLIVDALSNQTQSFKPGPVQGLHYQVPHSMYPQPDVVSESFERDWIFLHPSSSSYFFGNKFSSSNSNSISKRPTSLSYCHRDFYKRHHTPSPCSINMTDCHCPSQNPNLLSHSLTNTVNTNLSRNMHIHAPTTPGQYPNVSSVESEKIAYSPAPFPNSVASARSVQTSVGPEFSPASTPGSVLNRTYGSNCDESNMNPCSLESSSYYNSHNNQNRNQSNDPSQQSSHNHHALEANSLYLNIMLSDSLLNIFKDHNFDSCNICECTMSVQGSDIGLYLPGSDTSANHCKCGFSALMNKRYVEHSNLFLEDKEEVTGHLEKSPNKNLPSVWQMFLCDNESSNRATNYLLSKSNNCSLPSPTVLNKLFSQLIGVYNEYGLRLLLNWFKHVRTIDSYDEQKHSYEYEDACSVCLASLSQAQIDGIIETNYTSRDELINSSKCNLLHRSFFKRDLARLPENQNDQIRLLKTVRPWLQEAIGATRLLEACYTVDGPLTWKDFHQLAGRGSEETCEPQPLPYFAVSMENEGATVSPYAVKEWDLLGLEPFSHPKDVAYAVVLPNHELIVSELASYFTELSRAYKSCRLGRHFPFSTNCPNGFIRINSGDVLSQIVPSGSDSLTQGQQPINDFQDWFQQFQRTETLEESLKMIQLYVNHCSKYVVSVLNEHGVVDIDQFSSMNTINRDKNNPNSFTQHSWPSSLKDTSYQCLSNGSGPLSTSITPMNTENDIYLLIYLVNPFTLSTDYSEFYRLTTQALVSCSQTITEQLPEYWQKRVHFPHISLAEVLNNQDYLPRVKSMAFSSYTQIPRMLRPSLINANRTLTGMGPAGEKESISRKAENGHKKCVYSPPYVLADELRIDINDKSGVLFCSYLVSEDQCWLLASCTDEKGALQEYATINIDIPDRYRHKNVSPRHIGLSKLWGFIVSVVAQSGNPWRLIVERFGRMGHGELRGWNGLLSRKNLLRVNQQFRDNCSLCNSSSQISQPSVTCPDCPSLISACLISMELQSTIRVYPGAVKPEERASSGIPLSTPKDTSVTHILVFPTSTSASAQPDPNGQNDFEGIEFDLETDSIDMNVGLDELFHPHSPTRDSGAIDDHHMHDPNKECTDPQDAEATFMQQPLAIGFYLSTASPGPLPSWFWSACPQASRESPVCFKAALHLTTSLNQTDDNIGVPVHNAPLSGSLTNDSTSIGHLLDSTGTCDVLRFVLASYNALSWLTIDPFTNDRRSCLPIHVLSLLQLYHAQHAFL